MRAAPAAGRDEVVRVDRYLLLPAVDSLSVKLRGGRGVEVKRREDGYAPFRAGGLNGRIGIWKKWGLGEAVLGASTRDWVDVLKRRRLRHYGLDDGTVRALLGPQEEGPARGCCLELAQIELDGPGGEAWWTVCFEAFGPEPRATLDRAVLFALAQAPPAALAAARAQDYPAWLAAYAARPAEPPS